METFSALLALCECWPVDSSHNGQWHGALMFSLMCAWTKDWVKRPDVGDLRHRHCNEFHNSDKLGNVLRNGGFYSISCYIGIFLIDNLPPYMSPVIMSCKCNHYHMGKQTCVGRYNQEMIHFSVIYFYKWLASFIGNDDLMNACYYDFMISLENEMISCIYLLLKIMFAKFTDFSSRLG